MSVLAFFDFLSLRANIVFMILFAVCQSNPRSSAHGDSGLHALELLIFENAVRKYLLLTEKRLILFLFEFFHFPCQTGM